MSETSVPNDISASTDKVNANILCENRNDLPFICSTNSLNIQINIDTTVDDVLLNNLNPEETTLTRNMVRVKDEFSSNDGHPNTIIEFTPSTETTPERPQIQKDLVQRETIIRTDNASHIKDELYEATEDIIPDDFFDDLLQNAEKITAELGLAPESVPVAGFNVKTENATNMSENSKDDCHMEPTVNVMEILAAKDIFREPVIVKNELYTDGTNDAEAILKSLTDADNIPEGDPIPDNFFDDLLEDRVAARVARMESEVQEIKYAEQLKDLQEKLQQLEEEESLTKRSHKPKKSKDKKKYRKRSKSRERHSRETRSEESKNKRMKRTPSPIKHTKIIQNDDNSRSNTYNILEVNSAITAAISSKDYAKEINVPVTTDLYARRLLHYPIKVKAEVRRHANDNEELDGLPVPHSINSRDNLFSGFKKIKLEKISVHANAYQEDELLPLTPQKKREQALKLSAKAVQAFRNTKMHPVLSHFNFTTNVRKLPTSCSYFTQQIYENRSPLHKINNVVFAFNSTSTRLNIRQWGLEVLPKFASHYSKAVGYDANKLFERLRAAKIPKKLNKIKKENGETIEETKSSFFTNAMTQTDDIYMLKGCRNNGHDFGVQAKPNCGSIGTQTTDNIGNENADLPLMQLINTLNENQLLALNDFAELISEPASSAMDMYRMRQRMLEIYKCSQLPTDMPAPPASATVPKCIHHPHNYAVQNQLPPHQHDVQFLHATPAIQYMRVDPRLNGSTNMQRNGPQHQSSLITYAASRQQRQSPATPTNASTQYFIQNNRRR